MKFPGDPQPTRQPPGYSLTQKILIETIKTYQKLFKPAHKQQVQLHKAEPAYDDF